MSQRGMTLIEVVLAIVLLSILSTVAISHFMDFSYDAKAAVTQDRLADLKRAIIGDSRLVANGQFLKPGYLADVGALPTDLNDLSVHPGSVASYDPLTQRGWHGPYVDNSNLKWNYDAWDTEFEYDSATRTVRSCGPDLTCANADDLILFF